MSSQHVSQPIFNSLGSNYTWQFAWTALRQLVKPDPASLAALTEAIQERWSGKVALVYKGRDAIEYGLRVLKIGHSDVVLTQAFTCHAIEEAINRTGAQPGYVDLDEVRLNPSPKTLDQALKTYPQAKAVIIQHTLGLPAEIEKIRAWCDAHKLWLIEDLAQAAGGTDEHGKPLGTLADVVILSFGRDKVIDGVAGGAVVLRRPEFSLLSDRLSPPPALAVWQDLTYPILTVLIRSLFSVQIGKVIWKIGRLLGWLRSPVSSPTTGMTALPPSLAHLALIQLKSLAQSLAHRRTITETYVALLKNHREFLPIYQMGEVLKGATHQRFQIMVNNPEQTVKHLAAQKIFVSDRWYRSAVDSGSLGLKSSYQPGSCPVAEKIATHLINLPTHRNMTVEQANQIVKALYE